MSTVSTEMPRLVGAGRQVPLAAGGSAPYLNFDNAASTSALELVAAAVQDFLPWYSSVHRGAGFLSQVSTRAYEGARLAVAEFVGARDPDEVIFVRNSTEAINQLVEALPWGQDAAVVTTPLEHHANLLPWRRAAPVEYLPFPESPAQLLGDLRESLRARAGRFTVVAITGASNVTGEVTPLREIAATVHEYSAILFVDAAQLAPHRAIDMVASDIDFLCLSGHKMYAPFGAGALIGRREFLQDCEPPLAGGGAVEFVTLDSVLWTSLPHRMEAGSPNVIGAVALGMAAKVLHEFGMERVASHERALAKSLRERLSRLSGIKLLNLWSESSDHLGVCTFVHEMQEHALLAAALSAEYGIGVRHGCFCAHPYITHLLGVDGPQVEAIHQAVQRGDHRNVPGAVRMSLGIGNTASEVDTLLAALEKLLRHGPDLEYRQDDHGDFHPVEDKRDYSVLGAMPMLEGSDLGAGCGQL